MTIRWPHFRDGLWSVGVGVFSAWVAFAQMPAPSAGHFDAKWIVLGIGIFLTLGIWISSALKAAEQEQKERASHDERRQMQESLNSANAHLAELVPVVMAHAKTQLAAAQQSTPHLLRPPNYGDALRSLSEAVGEYDARRAALTTSQAVTIAARAAVSMSALPGAETGTVTNPPNAVFKISGAYDAGSSPND